MKLLNTKSGSKTKVKNNPEYDFADILDFQGAADRLASREQGGHFASSLSYMDLDLKEDSKMIGLEFDLKILYPCGGGMAEDTGKKIYLKIVE